MKEKFIVTIPVYKSGNTKLTKYISEINCNTLIVPQISYDKPMMKDRL